MLRILTRSKNVIHFSFLRVIRETHHRRKSECLDYQHTMAKPFTTRFLEALIVLFILKDDFPSSRLGFASDISCGARQNVQPQHQDQHVEQERDSDTAAVVTALKRDLRRPRIDNVIPQPRSAISQSPWRRSRTTPR